MTDLVSAPIQTKWGVIDIGSNSVRLVIYDGAPGAPIAVFNEKVLCGLGDRDPQTGALRESAEQSALSVLTRFSAITKATTLDALHVFATAAVRDAPNGPAFLAKVEAIGFQVRLISGEDEGRLSARGILSANPSVLDLPEGALAGDIGGGSLELCLFGHPYKDHLGPVTSLPLGVLRLSSMYGDDRVAARRFIRDSLKGISLLKEKVNSFYIVGGAWRSLARIIMEQQGHPLAILDQYTIGRDAMMELCSVISQQSGDSLASMPAVQRRRAPTLPFAALVMQAVLEKSRIKTIVVSASGLREGVLFDALRHEDPAPDPLLTMARFVAGRVSSGVGPDAGTMDAFLDPLFPGLSKNEQRLHRAASILCNIAKRWSPDGRAVQASNTVMNLPFRGIDHAGRVFLALVLFYRHGGPIGDVPSSVPAVLVDDEMHQRAHRLGLALRFAAEYDPSGAVALSDSTLHLEDEHLVLRRGDAAETFWGRGPAKRFARLANAFDRMPKD